MIPRRRFNTSAESSDVGGKGPQFAGVDLGAFDGGDALLAYIHPLCDLRLCQSQAFVHPLGGEPG
jgi:hypothetical protein